MLVSQDIFLLPFIRSKKSNEFGKGTFIDCMLQLGGGGGTTSFSRSLIVRPSIPRKSLYSDQLIEITCSPTYIETYTFPDHSIDVYTYSD